MSQVSTSTGPPLAQFTLAAAQRIAAAVKEVETASQNTSGGANPARPLMTQFWAMITGSAGLWGTFFDWVAVVPNAASAATNQVSTTLAQSNLWKFQVPYVAGFGNAREANNNLQVPPGTVVQLTFIGYSVPDGQILNTGTTINPNQLPPVRPDGSVPMYVFNYCMQQPQAILPIHDHRDNVTGGGFAFAVYHPGTALPQQPWSI
jgi:hypothetical protein